MYVYKVYNWKENYYAPPFAYEIKVYPIPIVLNLTSMVKSVYVCYYRNDNRPPAPR